MKTLGQQVLDVWGHKVHGKSYLNQSDPQEQGLDPCGEHAVPSIMSAEYGFGKYLPDYLVIFMVT